MNIKVLLNCFLLLFVNPKPDFNRQAVIPNTDVYVGDSQMIGNEMTASLADCGNHSFDRWTRQYTVGRRGGIEENNSQSGRTLCNDYDPNNNFENNKATLIPTYDPSVHHYLFFSFSFMDVFKGGGYSAIHSNFVTKYASAIRYIKSRGWPPNQIVATWYFYPIDLPPYNFDASDFRLLWDEVKNAIASEGVLKLDMHPYWSARPDNNDYSLNLCNNTRDYSHMMNWASGVTAGVVDSLISAQNNNITLPVIFKKVKIYNSL